jgi:chromosome segregation ATPase
MALLTAFSGFLHAHIKISCYLNEKNISRRYLEQPWRIMREREQQLEASRDDWKAKNKVRYEEAKALKARLKEAVDNRDKWKTTANEQQKALREAEQQQQELNIVIASLREELDELKKKATNKRT